MSKVSLNAATGLVEAEAGASLDQILRYIVPQGFFVPVSPGTRYVTVGGATATDIHGKNHHVEGTWGSHIQEMRLLLSSGDIITCSPTGPSSPWFWATVGGMGCTGIITRQTFATMRIESSLVSVDTTRYEHLDDLMAAMIEGDARYRYSVAWIDGLSASGRGVLTRGDHATLSQLPVGTRDPLAYNPKQRAKVPSWFPSRLLNPATAAAFNEAWFRKSPVRRSAELQSLGQFFHPLDGIGSWNRVYGKQGFLQYQFAVPDSAANLVATALSQLRRAGVPSFLTVLKRFGPANDAPLSFPFSGWTLAIDIPSTATGIGKTLDSLDAAIVGAGGRFYLAKDSRMSREVLEASYPRLDEWRSIRAAMDSRGILISDQARRLGLLSSWRDR